MDYETSLDRAYDDLPELGTEEDRLDVPEAALETDGAFVRFTNIERVADALDRDADHLHRYVQSELGTAGTFEGGQARYSGSFTRADFENAIDAYIAEFVTCSECGLPDTKLVKENRTQMLRCTACGAFRPISKRSTATSQQQQEAVEEGGTYEVEITGTGRKGDGVANRGKYTIFVSGAREGETVQAYVESTSGDLAFARKT
ncbi:translation initiation factor IF-2 subunit beta [Salinarchaeum sp. Harcht-Bsk1]|uniref:translation initiation factor IF-2 subunit beta n=1 Tax=Salinarchaeum sp. Harcht-Bsk1 TaxID=1333523 RepID=UPI0003423DE2|nr:translation initiation factor IF-2 subunit beta [Salinarchaeum sp. Harcht-Bsk1]AGN00816.1 translation initiation factor IF-2 subunit beta [Salinarchaeum sp. Harcht-Bsk1]